MIIIFPFLCFVVVADVVVVVAAVVVVVVVIVNVVIRVLGFCFRVPFSHTFFLCLIFSVLLKCNCVH